MDNHTNAHISLTVTVNRDNYSWRDPSGRSSLDFSIPLSMFESKKFSDLVAEIIREAKEDLVASEIKAKAEADKIGEAE